MLSLISLQGYLITVGEQTQDYLDYTIPDAEAWKYYLIKYEIYLTSTNISVQDHFTNTKQKCHTRIRVFPYILYYKVYNSNCCKVGHGLTDHVNCIYTADHAAPVVLFVIKNILDEPNARLAPLIQNKSEKSV